MRFVEALGSSTLIQHSRPLVPLKQVIDTMAGTKTATKAPTITHWQGKILPIGLPSAQVLQCSTPGSVSRWTGGGSRGRPPLFFSPFIAIFRDVIMRVVARMVARVARRRERRPARGNSQLRVSLSTCCRLRQTQMDSGGLWWFLSF